MFPWLLVSTVLAFAEVDGAPPQPPPGSASAAALPASPSFPAPAVPFPTPPEGGLPSPRPVRLVGFEGPTPLPATFCAPAAPARGEIPPAPSTQAAPGAVAPAPFGGANDSIVAPALFQGEPLAAGPQEATVSVPPKSGAGAPAEVAPPPEGAKRRGMPSPFPSPPFPGSEYQGYPLIGLPADYTLWPLMKYLQGTPFDALLTDNRMRLYGWVTVEGNLSSSRNSNTPDSYWVRPNKFDMDQALIRLDRNVDTVQVDHVDWGFKATLDYGIDYRYFTAGGWTSDQLLIHNQLYGYDLTEIYGELYIPWVTEGLIIRVGRWIACPDIETQFAPDNYMGSHSILFTVDTYTQTGIMLSFKLNDQWEVQAALHSGTDMAPWYPGAIPTGAFGVRWVAKDNNDATYTWLNAINDAKFRRFDVDGVPSGHDNFNYLVSTWEHRFNPGLVTKTEAYIMWQNDAVVGGTPSLGPLKPYGGGGGLGADIPGTTLAFGVLNFTILELGKYDFLTFRNEYFKDTDGERTGYRGVYTSNAIGWSHNFTPEIQFRPEIDFFRNWTGPAFDNGTRKNEFFVAFDFTVHF
jgi:hypothetical protein